MTKPNYERLCAWRERWREHTGQRPDLWWHLRQRTQGLEWPIRNGKPTVRKHK